MLHTLIFLAGLAGLFFAIPVVSAIPVVRTILSSAIPIVGAPSEQLPIPNPPPQYSYVLDQLNWLSESQEQEINTIARQLNAEVKPKSIWSWFSMI